MLIVRLQTKASKKKQEILKRGLRINQKKILNFILPKTKGWKIKHYVVDKELGRGTFGSVYHAINTINKQEYAIKLFPKSNLESPEEEARFQREVNAMAFLRHDNLIALHDLISDEENFYLVMDLCSGGELFDYIADNDKLPEPKAALVFRQIISAISYCHQYGVAHRDLKPENILIDKFPHIKISDFGLCGYIKNTQLMKTFCGSPCYCSPECLCRVQYDGRLSDVWSLGVVLFAIITGEHPWNISNTSIMLRQILKGVFNVPNYVSKDCKDLIVRMLKVNPIDRIKVEDIIEHPWLKKAENNPIATMRSLTLISSIEDLSEASANSSMRSDHNIISPFEEESSLEDDMSSRSAGLPRLKIRSASLDRFNLSTSTTNFKQRKRYVPVNLSVSHNRQKSASNLLLKQSVQIKVSTPNMMTIIEDP